MAVHFDPADIVTLEEFGGVAYLIPLHSKRDALNELLHEVTLLRWERGKDVVDKFHIFQQYHKPIDPSKFHACSQHGFRPNNPADRVEVQKWLRSLPIPAEEEVYVFRKTTGYEEKGCPTFITTWDRFASGTWYYIWNMFSLIGVVDDSAKWGVVFGPEPFIVYAEEGGVDPDLPISDPAYGLRLIHVRPEKAQDMDGHKSGKQLREAYPGGPDSAGQGSRRAPRQAPARHPPRPPVELARHSMRLALAGWHWPGTLSRGVG